MTTDRIPQPVEDWGVIFARKDAEITRLRAALEVCFRVLHFDLRKMITWGPDYNQAVRDAADATIAALKEGK